VYHDENTNDAALATILPPPHHQHSNRNTSTNNDDDDHNGTTTHYPPTKQRVGPVNTNGVTQQYENRKQTQHDGDRGRSAMR
jgi:hypothetical protein